jgi:hypothetical protein
VGVATGIAAAEQQRLGVDPLFWETLPAYWAGMYAADERMPIFFEFSSIALDAY